MAANKRRQDDKHLKILREVGSQQHNKQCFDCHQRGPTYVNMTIGSFVCTSCSGILRGLNPPHRVKSISMTSFTPEEIEFIKGKGNQYCRRVWLGTYDSRTMAEPESKDEQRIKDFMVQKYERKRWYVDPSMAFRNLPAQTPTTTTTTVAAATPATVLPETKPLTTILGNQVKPLVLQSTTTQVAPMTRPVGVATPSSLPVGSGHPPVPQLPPTRPSLDLLNEFAADPFASTPTSDPSSANANANFANFDSFNASGLSSPPSVGGTPMSTTSTSSQFGGFVAAGTPSSVGAPSSVGSNAFSAPPPQDKYAALADLDSLFNTPPPAPAAAPTASTSSEWENAPNPFSSSTSQTWTPTNPQQQAPFANPQQAAPFANPQQAAPFANPQQAAQYANQQQAAPYANQQQAAPFANQQQAAPFATGNPFSPSFPSQPTLPTNAYSSQFANTTPVSSPPGFGGYPTSNGQIAHHHTPVQNGNFPTSGGGGGNIGWPSNSGSGTTSSGWPGFTALPHQQGFGASPFQPNKMMSGAPVHVNAWQPSVGNPFASGAAQMPQRANSSNPFL